MHVASTRAPFSAILACWVLVLTFGGTAHAPAQSAGGTEIIRRIQIEGLKRESESDILSRLKIRIGDPYDRDRVSQETGSLWSMNRFQEVAPPRVAEFEDGVSITFVVKERPRVLSVRFPGRKELSERELMTSIPEMRTKTGALYSPATVRQDAETIARKYRNEGYVFANVVAQEVTSDRGVDVTFRIDEGSRVRIAEVRFEGNKSFSSSTLLSLLQTREKDWFFGLFRSGFYDPDKLGPDLRNIEAYYHRFGHFDARAQLLGVQLDAWKERLTIDIHVREGPSYVFQGYEIQGNEVFKAETLLGLARTQIGQPYNQDRIDADLKAISDYYFNRAYVFASVRPFQVISLDVDQVKVRIEIEEKNQIYIDEIKVRGNVATQDRVIRRELEFYPGEMVDWSKFEESRSNLNRLGLFRNVDFTFEEGTAPEKRNVVVNFEEEQFGRLFLQFGLSSDLGVIGMFRLRKNNFDITDLPEWPLDLADIPSAFTGAGQTFVLELQPGTQYSLYRLRFVEPYVFGTRNALSLALAHTTLRYDEYDETRSTFSPRLAHAFSFDRDFVFSVGYRLEEVEISNLDFDASPSAREAKGFNTVSAANVSVEYDKVLYEYLEGPYGGDNTTLFFEYGGGVLGGDIDFYKGIVTSEFYYPVFTTKKGPNNYHHVIALLNRFGVIEPHEDGESIPIFERFFLGGLRQGERVRGFDYRGLGPHELGQPVGGTGLFFGNFEYSFPIFPKALDKLLRGVAFFDYGNLSPTIEEFSFSQMRFSVGGGLRLNFPLPGQPFPLAFYLGFPIKKEDEDETRTFLFSIGTPF